MSQNRELRNRRQCRDLLAALDDERLVAKALADRCRVVGRLGARAFIIPFPRPARRIARAPRACGGQNRFVLGVRFLTNGVIMAKRTKRREWTKKHVRELKTLARQKTPAARIAKSLKRTLGATRQKAFSLGVSLDSRG